MKEVPKKNISSILADIKHLKEGREQISKKRDSESKQLWLGRRRPAKRKPTPYLKAIFASLSIIVLALGLTSFLIFQNFNNSKIFLLAKSQTVINNFQQALGAIDKLEPQEAVIFFDKNIQELTETKNFLERLHLINILNLKEFFNQIIALNQSALVASQNLETLKTKGLNLLLNGDGQELIGLIKNLKENIKIINQSANLIRNQITLINNKTAFIKDNFLGLSQINQLLTDKYLDYSPKFYQLEDFLADLLTIFQSNEDVHWLILFQNPAEIRPGGGFLGSYADLTINSGRLTNIDVRDIYDPDGQLEIKVIPPLPLQAITTRWSARDANWFFDFPLSAKKVIEFLEASKIYQEKNIQFQGAIALNVRILESILEITGPIKLSDYQLELNKDNFSKEVQSEVEAGPDKAKGEPKRILKVLTPILLAKINNFNEDEKREVMEKLKFHLNQKDLMFFAKERLQNFFSQNGFSGEVYKLPNNFWGSYLAVVNANIAGGKSDFFITQEIDFRVNLEIDGKANNQLKIKRTHNGHKEKASWWRATNQNFLKIFTSPDSRLIAIRGNNQKIIKPPLNYQKENYQKDSELQAIEKEQQFLEDFNVWAGKEFGKTALATWFNVPAGKTKILELEYETPANNLLLVKSGKVYQFIFDKQSGVDGKLKVTIEAPPGYKWQENQKTIYEYQSDNPPARVMVNLTLSKI